MSNSPLAIVLLGALAFEGCLVSFEDYPVGDLEPDGSAGSSGFGGGWQARGDAGAAAGAGSAGLGGSSASGGSAGLDGSAGLAGSAASCSAGLSCVAVDDGWTPVVVGPASTPCGGDWNLELALAYSGLYAPLECDCSCTAVCKAAVTPYDATGCGGPGQSMTYIDEAACGVVSIYATSLLVALNPPDCTPGGAATPKALSWGSDMRICTATSSDCPGGKCVPAAAQLCMYSPGDITVCPAGFSSHQVLYTGASDTRTCNACACDAGGVSCLLNTMTFYSSTTCTPPYADCQPDAGGCCDLGSKTAYSRVTASFLSSGSCAVSQSVFAGGFASETGPVTVCCP